MLWFGSPTPTNDSRSFKKYTPLPLPQIAILLMLRFCEAASDSAISPFLNELLTSITGDAKKVGYYAGMMNAIPALAALMTVMFWSRMSDHIGRKPILLLGTLALAISNLSIGLSRTFLALVVSRCIFVAFNSNSGVIKSVIGEITDHTNRSDAFAILDVPWAIGSSFGALVGGWLARPHDHLPDVFSSYIWIEYPYFLPYAVMAVITILGLVVATVYLKETVTGGYFGRVTTLRRDDDVAEPLLSLGSSQTPSSGIRTTDANEPVPLKHLLNIKILIPVASFVYLDFLYEASNAIQPLFLAMPVNIGGLGLTSRNIGYILGTYGLTNSIFQVILLGRLIRRFGVKTVFVTAVFSFIPMNTLSPIMNILLRRHGFSHLVWVILGFQLLASLVTELGFGCVYIYITAASPNKRSLGTINGLALTLVSISRVFTLAMANSLLAFSIQYEILWGYAVYMVIVFLTIGGIALALQWPRTLKSIDIDECDEYAL